MSQTQINFIEEQLRTIDAQCLKRQRRTLASPCEPYIQRLNTSSLKIKTPETFLAFCSNDYLGLANHPRMTQAMMDGIQRYGVGSGASHLISGHSLAHHALEQRLAAWIAPYIDQAQALYFCSGYMANVAVLSTLANKSTAVFSEALNHASLIDGIRLSRAPVTIYSHRDITQLAQQLSECTSSTKFIVTDSVFSMDGNLAPLPELLALAERYDAWLVVDDAHGFGVLGQQGRGALEHFDLHSSHLIYIGTLGKAAGVSGAFVAAHHSVIELLIQRARPYIFSTASAPALAHALLTSLDMIEGEEGQQRRLHLANMIQIFQKNLTIDVADRAHVNQTSASITPIQPIILGTNEAAIEASQQLEAQGIWVPAIRPPTVPQNTARLRVTLSAAHTLEDLNKLVTALNHIKL